MLTVRRVAEMKALAARWRREGRIISLVPTMGALHEGHRSLLQRARAESDVVVMSLFVNPLQFAPGEDFASYPRDFEGDCRQAGAEGVDALFAPSVDELYPSGFETYVEAGPTAQVLCGRSRPGHFRGVLTVVLKLLNIVGPHKAYFGEKDYQQLILVERMVSDLNLDVEVVMVPVVRDTDGVAASSRNAYLSQEERESARRLNRALRRAQERVQCGEREGRRIVEEVVGCLSEDPSVVVDYVAVCDPKSLKEVSEIEGEVVVALAAKVGRVRLIDNMRISPPTPAGSEG